MHDDIARSRLRSVALRGALIGLVAGAALVAADVAMAGVVPGLLIHFALAVATATGLVFALTATPNIARSPWAVYAAGLVAGALLWAHSLYMILPAAGFTSLALDSSPALQLLAHVAVFGVGIAGWLEATLPKDGFTNAFERALAWLPSLDAAGPTAAAARP